MTAESGRLIIGASQSLLRPFWRSMPVEQRVETCRWDNMLPCGVRTGVSQRFQNSAVLAVGLPNDAGLAI